MSKTRHTFLKVWSILLCFALCFTSYVLFVPLRADAVVTDNGASMQSADKYGTPVWSGSYNRSGEWYSHSGKWIRIEYPSAIYLDKSETLQSAGYKMKVTWNYGSSGNVNYRIILTGAVWGENNTITGAPEAFYTMTNYFSGYQVDASHWVSDSGKVGTLVPGESGSSTNYDVGVYRDSFEEYRGNETIIWRSGDAYDHTAYIYLKGTPTQTGTATYTTSAVNPTFGGYQTYSGGSWGGDGNLTSKPDSSEQYQGWDEIFWTVTIYDKSSLNSEITHAKNISEQNASYQAYLVAGNWNTFTSALNTASTRLTTRAITQNELDSAENTLNNAANALVFAASDTELQAKLSEAMAIYNSNTYATDYTADSRATFEDIITRVRNSSYATTQYSAYSDALAGSRAAQDQTVIDSLTEQVKLAINSLQKVGASFAAFDSFVAAHMVSQCATGSNVTAYNELVAEVNGWKDDNLTVDDQADIDAAVARLEELYNAFEYSHAGYDPQVISEPTCEEPGEIRYTCSRCGDSYIEYTDPLGHDFSAEFTVDKAATCTETGLESRHCSRCDAIAESRPIAMVPHQFTVVNEESRVPATCQTEGSVLMECAVCGTVDEENPETLPIDPNNHTSIGDWEEETPATCGEAGLEVQRCEDCGNVANFREIPATGNHTVPEEWDEVVQPVCGTDGYQVKYCTECGQEVAREVLPATDSHDMVPVAGSRVEPTCIADGSEVWVCTKCGHQETRVLPMTPDEHQTVEIITDPTCGQAGSRVIQCTVCQRVFLNEEIPATGDHHYSVVEETVSTCATPGHRLYQCSGCQNMITETFSLDPENHEGPQVLLNQKDATCGADGYTGDLACQACGYVYEHGEVIPATGEHTYDGGRFIIAATENHDGVKRYTCTGCGIYYDETIPWTGAHTHHGGEGSATCTMRAKCEECGEPYGEYDNSNHTGLVNTSAQAATCTQDGCGEGVFCEDCLKYVTEPEVIPALGHVDANGDEVCDRCGAEVPEEVTLDTFRCSMCDNYEANKDKPLVGWIYSFFHTIVHFFESLRIR